MTKHDKQLTLEALKAARLEFNTLIEEDIHVPSGALLEQLAEAEMIIEVSLATQ